MRKFILSSPTLTAAGEYEYKRISSQQAGQWLREGVFISAIRCPDRKLALEMVLNCGEIGFDHSNIRMNCGDEALVYRLKLNRHECKNALQSRSRIWRHVMRRKSEFWMLRRMK